jgi:putative acyl-CoA dehydrogenase
MATHEVLNQPPPLEVNLFAADVPLQEAVARGEAEWAKAQLLELGQWAGSRAAQSQAAQANENPPRLRTHDRYGNRIDEVEFHPAWHELMRVAVAHGVHSLAWEEDRDGAHVARAALMFLDSQCEQGHGCPISMTYSAVPALRRQAELAGEWEPRAVSREYDSRSLPPARKRGALIGMAMTEKQGGSDVRANTTRAGRDGEAWRLTGHKWFCSAPMSDAFLVLAQAPKGLSCFLVPRWTPDEQRNRFFLQRLKDKLGNRSNASAEIELDGAWGQLVGEEGRGVPAILEMVNHTRLDCVLGSAAILRQALWQAAHHCAHRRAFGKLLVDQPAMRNVLADLCVEAEAALLLAMRLARAYDAPPESAFRRIATAISKYWVCKRAPAALGEALECLGGNGYVEESGMPRLYREAPLNSIWEGSGNVICLDVLRALAKEPAATEALLAELRAGRGTDRRLDAHLDATEALMARASEGEARRLTEALALALQGALLVRHSPSAVADAFCASRLAGDWGHTLGTLPHGADVAALVERARPTTA